MRESRSSLRFRFQCQDCWSPHRAPKLVARDKARGRCRCAGVGRPTHECRVRQQSSVFCLADFQQSPKVAPTLARARVRLHQCRFRQCRTRHFVESCHRSDKSPVRHNQSSIATQCCARAYLRHRLIVRLSLAATTRGSHRPRCSFPRPTAR